MIIFTIFCVKARPCRNKIYIILSQVKYIRQGAFDMFHVRMVNNIGRVLFTFYHGRNNRGKRDAFASDGLVEIKLAILCRGGIENDTLRAPRYYIRDKLES